MDYEDTLSALREGVIPPKSVLDFSVGRENELNEFKNILNRVEKGSAVTKFINGEFGIGKSFFLKMIEETAFEDNFVVSRLTISHNLQFHQIENIYKEIAKTLKCKTGESLNHIIERWVIGIKAEAKEEYEEDSEAQERETFIKGCVNEDLITTRDYSNTFATAIENHVYAKENNDIETADFALAWVMGDSHIPANKKNKFGVKGEIKKEQAFEFLEALSTFIHSIGYPGLIILIDEAEYILKTYRNDSRSNAYNYIRDILDNCSNGTFSRMLFVFAGTPEFYEDERRGIRSYDALYKRISNVHESEYNDYRNPILNLRGLNENNIKELSKHIINMHKQAYNWDTSNVEAVIDTFIEIQIQNSGLTGGEIVPREFIRELVSVLDVVQQNQDELNYKDKIIEEFKEANTRNTKDAIDDDW
jgi:hypothetical protein